MMEKQSGTGLPAHVARYWEKAGLSEVRCTLCPHHCRLKEGQTGRCRVRTNQGGSLFAKSYGAITSLALDPIEKKPLRYFHSGSQILSVGSYGCNLSCDFCQNWQISQQEAEFIPTTPEQLARKARQLSREGNIGLAYTYNEPMINIEFVSDCATLIHRQGQKNVLVTNGYIEPWPLRELLPLVDAMNIDLKAFNGPFYQKLCHGELAPVLRSIELAVQACHVEVTTLLIPGYNDQEKEIEQLANWLAGMNPDIPLHLTRYFPAWKMRSPQAISRERLNKLADIARRKLTFVVLGNV